VRAHAFWLSVLTELNNRGVKDIFIACVDGLKGFTEAIESVFPNTITQLCIVHQIRNSLTYISYKDRKAVVADLKPIYTAITEDEALFALELFREKWNGKYPLIAKSWQANWQRLSPMFGLPKEIRKAVYTTNVIESLNYSLRKSRKRALLSRPKKPPSNCFTSACKTPRRNGQCRYKTGAWR
jgi:transposase-like protein